MVEPTAHDAEHRLGGGKVTIGVVRVGETVRRPLGTSWRLVHALLRHLEEVGFPGSPRLLGIDDQGREILTFHAGLTLPEAPDLLDSDESLVRVAELVRDFHRASASFAPPADAPIIGVVNPLAGRIVLHGDLAPWNLLAGADQWVIIDWDEAAPGRVEWELAYVLHTFVDLWHTSPFSDAETAHRLRVFADAYEMSNDLLQRTMSLVPQRCLAVVDFVRDRAERQEPAFLRMIEEGDDAGWLAGARHVEKRLPSWIKLLK